MPGCVVSQQFSAAECATVGKKHKVCSEMVQSCTWDEAECRRTCQKFSQGTPNLLSGLVPVQVPADGTQESGMLLPMGLSGTEAAPSSQGWELPLGFCGFRGTETLQPEVTDVCMVWFILD